MYSRLPRRNKESSAIGFPCLALREKKERGRRIDVLKTAIQKKNDKEQGKQVWGYKTMAASIKVSNNKWDIKAK